MSTGAKNGFPEINDIRNENEFRGITFSKYKLSDVTKALLKSMTNSRIEPHVTGRLNLFVRESLLNYGSQYLYLWENTCIWQTLDYQHIFI